VLNAGDGGNEPSHASLLDALTIRRAKGRLCTACTSRFAGDIAHSRWARSNILAAWARWKTASAIGSASPDARRDQ